MIEIEGPDGTIYEFPDGTDQNTMRTAMQKVYGGPSAAPEPEGGGLFANFGAGTQRGIANVAGLPVDAVSGAISGVGQLTGWWDPIENPVGGSESIYNAMQPLHGMVPEPVNAGERAARRVGEEVGGAAAAGPLGVAANPARAGSILAADMAGGVTGGASAAAANEVFPDSGTADVLAALTGGLAGSMGAVRTLGAGAVDPNIVSGIDEQRRIANEAYGQVRADQSMVPAESTTGLAESLIDIAGRERLNPRLQPSSSAVLDAIIDDLGGPMRVEELEDLRRITQQNMPVTAVPADQRIAGMMRDEISRYLDEVGGESAEALRTGRDAHRRVRAAEAIQDATTRGQRRAASTGSGGNEINAVRQNIRSILDSPRKRRSFNADELAAMDAFVRGDVGSNLARSISRVAPSSGGLSAMLGIGGMMASPAIAGPVAIAGEAGKYIGRRQSRRAADNIMKMIAPDRITSVGDQGISPIIQALLGARVISQD